MISPFVTRPTETVLGPAALGLAPARPTRRTGVYRLRAANGPPGDGSVVLQGSAVAYAFVQQALPRLVADGIELDVYYVASAELFDALPPEETRPDLPARGRGGGDRDHRLHHADAVPVGHVGARAGRVAVPRSGRATSWAAVRGRRCCARPGSTARASTWP